VRVALLLTPVFAAALAFGCGSDKAMTLEEYLQGVEGLMGQLHAQEAPLLGTLESSDDVGELKAALAQYPEVERTFVTGLKTLDPPEEASVAHENAIAASGDFIDALVTAIDDTAGAQTVESFFNVANSAQIAVASGSVTVACNGLQELADANGIEVAMGCPVDEDA
jgi:hypothetical protein